MPGSVNVITDAGISSVTIGSAILVDVGEIVRVELVSTLLPHRQKLFRV